MKKVPENSLRVLRHEEEVVGLLTDCQLSTSEDEDDKNNNEDYGEVDCEEDCKMDGEVHCNLGCKMHCKVDCKVHCEVYPKVGCEVYPKVNREVDCKVDCEVNCEVNRRVNRGVNCDMNHKVNCDVNRKMNCDVNRGVNCDVNRKVNCDVNRGVNCEVNRKVNCDVNCDVNRGVNCDVNRKVNCDVNRKVNCDMNCDVNRKVNCDVNRKVNCDVNRKVNYEVNLKMNGEMNRKMNGEMNRKMNGEMNCKMNGEMDSEMDKIGYRDFYDKGDNNERKHQKLLDVICGLGGKKRLMLAERSEASPQVSEFGVSTEGAGEKLELTELLAPIKVSSSLGTVKKQLKNVKNKKTVDLPLSKEENERILREAAYNKISQDMDKWDPIVMRNRRAAQLVFPLEQERVLDVPIEEVLEGWKVSTPLEKEIFSLLHKNKRPVNNTLLTSEEKASLKAMSLEEAKLRRAELQKARALQSYYEARARREKKVKSKRFHKILKKKKTKEALKQFEQLRKINPAAALEELKKMENARIQERMTLKHQNSGKWAKSKAIMAKYDLGARKAMQEQLIKNRELTQKLEVPSDNEYNEVDEEDTELIPAIVNEVQLSIDGPNPWMQKQRLNHPKNSPTQKKPVVNEVAESKEEEEDMAEDELLLQEVEERRALRKRSEVEQGLQKHTMTNATANSNATTNSNATANSNATGNSTAKSNATVNSNATGNSTANSNATVNSNTNATTTTNVNVNTTSITAPRKTEEDEELLVQLRDLSKQLNQKAKKIRQNGEQPVSPPSATHSKLSVQIKEQALLNERPASSMESDLESLDTEEGSQEQELLKPVVERQHWTHSKQMSPQKMNEEPVTDLNTIISVKAHIANSFFSFPTIIEQEDCDEDIIQKQLIREAFAGDDVIADFEREKREAEKASQPKDIDLRLPGWGQWGGPGLVMNARKKRRFLIKAPQGSPRKDKCLPNVVITEKRNIHAAAHQVNVLPFPFTHPNEFEQTIKTPVGTMWNTQRAFQKLTAPRVVTKPGHIIEPIKENDVESSPNSHFELPNLQKKGYQYLNHSIELKKVA